MEGILFHFLAGIENVYDWVELREIKNSIDLLIKTFHLTLNSLPFQNHNDFPLFHDYFDSLFHLNSHLIID